MGKPIRFFLCCLVFLGVVACTPSDAPQILKGKIGGEEYFVPKAYFILKSKGKPVEDSIYVRAMYPHFEPRNKSERELRREGEWFRSVRILASLVPKPNLEAFLNSRIKFTNATYKKGKIYGLIHRTAPPDNQNDHGDLFIENENGEFVSFIGCTKKHSSSSVPQCEHFITYKHQFSLNISYDKKLLPHWKHIKQQTFALLKSFETEPSAREFLKSAISNSNNIKLKTGDES